MFDLNKILRPNVKALKPYSSARDEFSNADIDGVFLDANENPYGSLNRYPDPYQKDLKAAISRIKGVPVKNIFLGNGSDEVIDICYRTFCQPGIDKAISFSPTYGMYGVSASINDVKMIDIPLDKSFNIEYDKVAPYLNDDKVKLLFICSPNNPSGNCMDKETIEKILSNFNGIVIIDEAYNDFSGVPSYSKELDKYPNLIVLQTFSKAYGLASIRIGMAFTSESIIGYFNKMKPPYNISKINQLAALERLNNMDDFSKQLNSILSERKTVVEELKKLPITIKVYPSDANFILAETTNANDIYNYLVDNNIIVRNRNTVVNNCLRITIGTSDENKKLIQALADYSTTNA